VQNGRKSGRGCAARTESFAIGSQGSPRSWIIAGSEIESAMQHAGLLS
jgi:hypothetical protein